MTETKTLGCSDCEGTMQEITVIDRGHANSTRTMEYAAIDAKQSIWTGLLPVAGRVKSFMCRDCGLIKFYGVPRLE